MIWFEMTRAFFFHLQRSSQEYSHNPTPRHADSNQMATLTTKLGCFIILFLFIKVLYNKKWTFESLSNEFSRVKCAWESNGDSSHIFLIRSTTRSHCLFLWGGLSLPAKVSLPTDLLLHDKVTASFVLLIVRLHLSGPKLIFFLVLSEGGPVVCDLVSP